MRIIAKIAKTMQTILTDKADIRAREVGFIKRQRQFIGSTFAQTLVFGWLDNPEASLEELTQTAVSLGVKVTPQALEQRFTEEAAEFLKSVLEDAVSNLIYANPVSIPILQRFQGVYIQDSSIVMLPDKLSHVWQGCGGRFARNTRSSVKLQVRLNMNTGELNGPHLEDGKTTDTIFHHQMEQAPAGALMTFDLGYFSLKSMRKMDQKGVYWLSRIYSQCVVYDHSGKKWDMVELLKVHCYDQLDIPIFLGTQEKLPCRFMAVRVPAEVSRERRRKMRAAYKAKGKTPSKRMLALNDWTVLVGNAPQEIMSLEEAFVLKRIRWQIELLFKLWKSHGRIDEWRSEKPFRRGCKIFCV